MSLVEEYLAIPDAYGGWLGGLRWANRYEAVEHAAEQPEVGLTFAMAGEVAEFLQGFQAARPLIPFAYVLHLLRMLHPGPPADHPAHRAARLASAFLAAGRLRMRHAGLFCGTLCRDIPRSPNPPEPEDLDEWLRRGPTQSELWHEPNTAPELPSLEPDEFQARVLKALEPVSDEALTHWLAHGRGPADEAAEAIVEDAMARRPPSFAQKLEALARRPRLERAAALMTQLEAALTLPARRLADPSPPVGGYADVTTRGNPEQILPGQFALDDLEFLRRFAGRELLYYHREPPRASIDEEMILVVDQGVRTWGDVRLVLSAAALAFARQADRKGRDLRIAATSDPHRLAPVADLDAGRLGLLLEASDLTLHPAEVLERILERPSDRPRDVILLTHPRNLAEGQVAAVAAKARPGTRLFAIAVDDAGSVEMSEVRRGVPVILGRCRVAVREAPAATTEPARTPDASPCWRGDVEPIGFPFRLGVLQPLDPEKFAFDHDATRILAVAGALGLLYCWRVDGSGGEMLPRALFEGSPLTKVEAIVGVAGGFAVVGRRDPHLIVAHYDFETRTCTVHRLESSPFLPDRVDALGNPDEPASNWFYIRHLHSVVVRTRPLFKIASAIDLGADAAWACFDVTRQPTLSSKRAIQASREARSLVDDLMPIVPKGWTVPATGSYIQLVPETGMISGRVEGQGDFRSTPLSDGKPALISGKLIQARHAGGILAVLSQAADGSRKLRFHDARGVTPFPEAFVYSASTAGPPEAASLRSYPFGKEENAFVLSRDGRWFARRQGAFRLEVRGVDGGLMPAIMTARQPFHDRMEMDLKPHRLSIRIGKIAHEITWGQGPLRMGRPTVPGVQMPYKFAPTYDPGRFVSVCKSGNLVAWLDALGHVALLDAAMRPVAIFFAFRQEVAAWLPDGTKFGPASLIGGPSSPDAARRIGEALRSVEEKQP